MSKSYLKNGKLYDGFTEDETAGLEPAVICYVKEDGAVEEVSDMPVLKDGEGMIAYEGDFFVEPLEIQVEFLKADDATGWLSALILRHADRVHSLDRNITVYAAIGEVKE